MSFILNSGNIIQIKTIVYFDFQNIYKEIFWFNLKKIFRKYQKGVGFRASYPQPNMIGTLIVTT